VCVRFLPKQTTLSTTLHGPSREHLEKETWLENSWNLYCRMERDVEGEREFLSFHTQTHTQTHTHTHTYIRCGIPPFEVPSRSSRLLAITRSSACYCDLVHNSTRRVHNADAIFCRDNTIDLEPCSRLGD